jgi:hypothetical protein
MLERFYHRLRTTIFNHLSQEFRQYVESNTAQLRADIADLRDYQFQNHSDLGFAQACWRSREQALVNRVQELEATLASTERMLLTYCVHLDRSGRRVLSQPHLNIVEEQVLEQVRQRFGTYSSTRSSPGQSRVDVVVLNEGKSEGESSCN